MCRLFGFRSAVMSRAHRSLIAAHNSVAEQAREHPHGWGIGYYQGGEAYVIKSEAAAANCERFRRAADQVASHTLIAHVRRATVGEVGPLNTHPFRNGRWMFAHNGTVHGFDKVCAWLIEQTPPDLLARRLGSTDTEALFLFLLGRLGLAGMDVEGGGSVNVDAAAAVLVAAVGELRARCAAAGTGVPAVNFLLTNGVVFLAHRDGRELFFATQKHVCRDATSCLEPQKPCLLATRPHNQVNHLIVASERIGDEDIWEEIPEQSIVTLSESFRLRVWHYAEVTAA